MISQDSEAGSQQHPASMPSTISDWRRTPEIILANIFTKLPVLDRMRAAEVCREWKRASYHPLVWQSFDYGVTELYDLDTWEMPDLRISDSASDHQLYIKCVCDYGEVFSRVHIVLHNSRSFEVFNEVAEECENLRSVKIVRHELSLEFPESFSRLLLFFLTGNRLLEEISLEGITVFKERPTLPIPIGPAYAKTLKRLSFINSFRQNNMSPLMYLVNLQEFTISPELIRFGVLMHLAKASLHTLNLVAKPGMWEFDCKNLKDDQWKMITEASNCRLKINCYLIDTYECSGILLSAMPVVKLVVCRSMHFNYSLVVQMLQSYRTTLTTFIDFSLAEEVYKTEPDTAVDDSIITIVQSCPKLTTLTIKDCLHSSTVLLMAQLNTNLRDILIREDMVRYVLHIPETLVSLGEEMKSFTEQNYAKDKFEGAMSQLLQCKWHVLSKRDYHMILMSRYASFS
ncbi:hypothetical protein BaRGS_00011513 [Batillaria attramentaria]|uniref:F-box domain-containing protein n=1 Tax=Batillaria attramentaria TaxID=370345 RepID=A0ABD0LCE9_9CAEN